MAEREKYIEVLSNTVKAVKDLNEDAPIKISLQCVEDILELLKEQEHKDRMFHALEEDWKRLKELLKEQECKDKIKGRRMSDAESMGMLFDDSPDISGDAFIKWCSESHMMGYATLKGIKYWVGKYKDQLQLKGNNER